jgi:hypothetical protein
MKRHILLLLFIVITLAAVSCAAKETANQADDPKEEQTEESIGEIEDETEVTKREDNALRDKYPEYFDLPTMKGLEVYVWQMAENSYLWGVMEGTNRNKTEEELLALKGVRVDDMKAILDSYDIPKENISIIPWQNPISSYIAEYWITLQDEDPAAAAKRRQEYVDKLYDMLMGTEETGFQGTRLFINVAGKPLTFERYKDGTCSLTQDTLLGRFSEETEMDGIEWEVYSVKEHPDLSYILVISGTNACWTYYRLPKVIETVSKAAYVNWTEDSEIYSSCLNADKIPVDSEKHVPVYRIDTKKDLDLFKDKFKNSLSFDSGYNEMPSFNEGTATYDDRFFNDHSLLLAYVTSGSGSFRFEVRAVIVNGTSLFMSISQANFPEVYTSDMAGWLMIAEIADADIKDVTDFDALMAEHIID